VLIPTIIRPAAKTTAMIWIETIFTIPTAVITESSEKRMSSTKIWASTALRLGAARSRRWCSSPSIL